MVVEALSTSIMTAIDPARVSGSTVCGSRWDDSRGLMQRIIEATAGSDKISVRGRKGRHWGVGKFGEDSVLWTPIATVARAYEGQFDRVWVLRLKTGGRGERP